VREYDSPEARLGDVQIPVLEVDVCESMPGSSQFTQVTLVPRLIETCAGTNAKFRMKTTTVPAAGEEIGIRHSPLDGRGPVADCLSEKQLDNQAQARATFTMTARIVAVREAKRLMRFNSPSPQSFPA
jgi:hypothetical protein